MTQFKNKEEMMTWHKEEHAKRQIELENARKQRWENLKPFEHPYDVPQIPIVDKEEYHNYYVPKLIAAGAIPKKDLIDGQFYIGDHRRCCVAKWDAKENEFQYWRTKFTQRYIDTCNHFEDDDGFALFTPIKIATEKQFENNEI